MKKMMPIIIVAIIAVVLIIGGRTFLGKGGVSLPVEIEKEAGQEDETFTGKLKEAIARGIPMKCTNTQGDFTGTGYIKGKKYYGKVSSQGKEGYVIMKDNCMWSWSKGEAQGVKICFETDIWEQEEGTTPTEAGYRCVPAVVLDSKFTLPANVNFMDLDDMMGGMGE